MRAPDAINPRHDWHEDFDASNPPSLSVYPPTDDEPAAELLGPDGEPVRRWRRNPIGYHEENGRG